MEINFETLKVEIVNLILIFFESFLIFEKIILVYIGVSLFKNIYKSLYLCNEFLWNIFYGILTSLYTWQWIVADFMHAPFVDPPIDPSRNY